jgi:hypothetical protein
MSPIGNKKHFIKILSSITVVFLLGAALVISLGCDVLDINKQSSVGSGTTTGFGSSGGQVANVSVTAANNTMVSGGTTIITVILTDASGRRTDASILLTSSGGGVFSGTTGTTGGTTTGTATFTGSTLGGILTATYTAPSLSSINQIYTVSTEIDATVSGTTLKGSTFITITSLPY